MRLFLLCTCMLDEFWLSVLAPLIDDPSIELVGALVDVRKPVPFLRKVGRELRKGRGAYIVMMGLKLLVRSLTPGNGTPTTAYLRDRGIEVGEVEDLYSSETVGFIEETKPDCIFRFGFGLIKEPVLSLAPKGVISYHHGNLRGYRGQPVGFWELYAGEPEMHVTVQVLNERLDAGKIVIEKPVEISPTDAWGSLERRAFDESRSMIHDSCVLLMRNGFEPEAVPEGELGSLNTIPNLRQWTTLQAKVLLRKLRVALELSLSWPRKRRARRS